jgi:hypothetical protein
LVEIDIVLAEARFTIREIELPSADEALVEALRANLE